MRDVWRAFLRNTLGIAPVPTPIEELKAATADVRAAIAAAAERYRNGNPDSAEFDINQCADCGRNYSGDFHAYCPARVDGCTPSGCQCDCHKPGMHVAHIAACCIPCRPR